MLVPEPVWETRRLQARPAKLSDAGVLFAAYACDPAVTKYLTWRPHSTVGDTVKYLQWCEQSWADRTAFPWTLWNKDDGGLVGMLEIRIRGYKVDLGYALAQSRWRQGYMSEALTPIVQWALAHPQIYRVWATCDVDNDASARVLERIGMAREGTLRRWLLHPNISNEPRDCYCYAFVKA